MYQKNLIFKNLKSISSNRIDKNSIDSSKLEKLKNRFNKLKENSLKDKILETVVKNNENDTYSLKEDINHSKLRDEFKLLNVPKNNEIGNILHYPVMYKKIIEFIKENEKEKDKENNSFLVGDLTFGLGSHSKEILKNFNNSYILGLEIDKKIIDISKKDIQIQNYIEDKRLVINHSNYVDISSVINLLFSNKSISKGKKPYNNIFKKDKLLDYAILDLGYNSQQLLPELNKGFSYMNLDNDLDMRFDETNINNSTGSEILNNSQHFELSEIFKLFGDEKYSDLLSKNIVEMRAIKKFQKVRDFIEAIDKTFSSKIGGYDKFNVYARNFQALRMAVNYEILNIQNILRYIPLAMENNSLLFVISFHSLEDKTVKNMLRIIEKKNMGNIIGKKIIADSKELSENSRSKSAIMRIFKFKDNNIDNTNNVNNV